MNYINQIKAFHDLNETNAWTTGQIALWYALMYINNKCYWSEWFSASNQVLSLHSGLSRQGILKARNALKQAGIIDFKAKGTKSTSYHLVDLMSKSSQVGCQDSCQASSQVGCQDSCTIININKNIIDADGDICTRAREAASSLVDKYWGRKATDADTDHVSGLITDFKTMTVSEDKTDLLKYAFECSLNANVMNWNYIHGVLDRIRARGIMTLDQAYEFDVKRDFGG